MKIFNYLKDKIMAIVLFVILSILFILFFPFGALLSALGVETKITFDRKCTQNNNN